MRRKDRRHTDEVELCDARRPERHLEAGQLLAVLADALGEKDLLRDVGATHHAALASPLTESCLTHKFAGHYSPPTPGGSQLRLPHLEAHNSASHTWRLTPAARAVHPPRPPGRGGRTPRPRSRSAGSRSRSPSSSPPARPAPRRPRPSRR